MNRSGSYREGAMLPLVLSLLSFLAIGATGGADWRVGAAAILAATLCLVTANICVRRIEDDAFKNGIITWGVFNFIAQAFGAAVTMAEHAPKARGAFGVAYILMFAALTIAMFIIPVTDAE